MWRILLSERMSTSLIEIETDWTMADVERANLALDISEDAEILSTPKH